MFRALISVLILICGFVCAPLEAADLQSHYVTTADLPPQLLAPPPLEGSAAWRNNIQGVLIAQKHIDADDLTAMRDEQHLRLRVRPETL